MNDLTLQFNKRGTLLGFEGELENNLLVPSAECVGKDIREIMPSDIAQSIISCIEKAFQTGELQSIEYQSWMSDSQYELRFLVSGDDKVTVIMTNMRDRGWRLFSAGLLTGPAPLIDEI